MKSMYFFSSRFAFYVVIRKARYEWMELAIRDCAMMVRDMDWNKHIEGGSCGKR